MSADPQDWRAVLAGEREWAVVLGDCFDVLRELPAGSVDAVVTDPPYGTGAWLRPESGAGGDCRAVMHLESWDRWTTDWLDDAWRVARGSVGAFLAPREMRSLLEWIGERPWRMFVWTKTDPRPRFSGQPAYGFDPYVITGKVQPVGGTDCIAASSPRVNRDHEAAGHPHQKRVTVMCRMVDLTAPPAGLVLDPFAGSGTTGVAALQTGRRFIGVEIDPTYHAIAVDRLTKAAAARQPALPMEAAP